MMSLDPVARLAIACDKNHLLAALGSLHYAALQRGTDCKYSLIGFPRDQTAIDLLVADGYLYMSLTRSLSDGNFYHCYPAPYIEAGFVGAAVHAVASFAWSGADPTFSVPSDS